MKLAVFVDYDNLQEGHKVSGVLDVITKAFLRTPIVSKDVRGICDFRIYGGWYEGPTMTKLKMGNSRMSVHSYTEDQLVEQPAIGLFAELDLAASPPNAGATCCDRVYC
jgi:hypothetical protein